MEPRGKGGFSLEGVNFAENFQERLLRQVFGFRLVFHNAEAQVVNAPAVPPIESLEGSSVARLSQPNDFHFRSVAIFIFLFDIQPHASLLFLSLSFGLVTAIEKLIGGAAA
jgi:hypothetical protein